mgnify:CR=1 FL=1
MNQSFANDVLNGLSSEFKSVPSKYFYDDKGSRLFQKIMEMPEYYLTECEFEIIDTNKSAILNYFQDKSEKFNLIEFGAGDGLKTNILLEYFSKENADFNYVPIDISQKALDQLKNKISEKKYKISYKPINDDYFKALHSLKNGDRRRKNIILFLGSNIGNFKNLEAIHFLRSIRKEIQPGDMLFIGFDLKKDPEIILNAYNDEKGITKAFNLNLLKRINDELGGEFDTEKFMHYPNYDPVSGETKSFLISKELQKVRVNELNRSFTFKQFEPVFLEISQKYDFRMISNFASNSGFQEIKTFMDKRNYFTNMIWEAV